ncbi:hypothetical protein GCM10022255_048800 [Dactylosporangium darangshiense]|uniref:DUF4234 domain-containing protein n=1 Tax=Dactylosporangium darangshiense TaxID=579108 RepID=A0ABP8DC79_9ACTN
MIFLGTDPEPYNPPERDPVADVERVYPVRELPDGPAVALPWIGTSWVERGARYRRRRALTAAGAVLTTLAAAGLTAAGVDAAFGSSGTTGRVVFAAIVLLLAAYGYFLGRHWLRHVPTREANDAGRGSYFGGFLLILAPMGIGFAAAALHRFFGEQFPGEQRAREVTQALRA